MMTKPIYLDYAASTPLDSRVLKRMQTTLADEFGNPTSSHVYGKQALAAIALAREQVASAIHALPDEIIWTSGATEANNLALKGVAHLLARRGKHIITSKCEHKAILDTAQHLEKAGFSVTYLKPEPTGLIDFEKFKAALRPDTILVSLMAVNNETGVIQDLSAIGAETRARGILLHVDAAQAIGKIALDVKALPIDLLSLCAHKVYGPKGIGALYLRKKPRVRVEPLIHGGGHEQGMRSGTLATHQIVGMGAAFQLAQAELEKDNHHAKCMRDTFRDALTKIAVLRLNCDLKHTVPHILNVRFEGMLAEPLLAALPMIATSTASACVGKTAEGSYVLRAMGLSEAAAKGSVRFSFGRFTTLAEINLATEAIKATFSLA